VYRKNNHGGPVLPVVLTVHAIANRSKMKKGEKKEEEKRK
jgi:hypothetical protein